MRNKVGESEFSTGSMKLEKAKFYTQAFVLLYLFVYTSAKAQLGCSVTRARPGDGFVFFNYSGTCNKGINPCKQIKGVWRNSARNCLCQCMRSNSTYREDLGSCVENEASREGRYPYTYKIKMVIMVKANFLTWLYLTSFVTCFSYDTLAMINRHQFINSLFTKFSNANPLYCMTICLYTKELTLLQSRITN